MVWSQGTWTSKQVSLQHSNQRECVQFFDGSPIVPEQISSSSMCFEMGRGSKQEAVCLQYVCSSTGVNVTVDNQEYLCPFSNTVRPVHPPTCLQLCSSMSSGANVAKRCWTYFQVPLEPLISFRCEVMLRSLGRPATLNDGRCVARFSDMHCLLVCWVHDAPLFVFCGIRG